MRSNLIIAEIVRVVDLVRVLRDDLLIVARIHGFAAAHACAYGACSAPYSGGYAMQKQAKRQPSGAPGRPRPESMASSSPAGTWRAWPWTRQTRRDRWSSVAR